MVFYTVLIKRVYLTYSDQKGGEKIGKKITASGMLLYEKRKLESLNQRVSSFLLVI